MSVKYFESVAFVIQHVMRLRNIVICGLFGSTKCFHVISQTARLSEKVTERKICGLIFSINFE
jgi:hypothetical protein